MAKFDYMIMLNDQAVNLKFKYLEHIEDLLLKIKWLFIYA